ncbi:hypothetical protein [Silvimonas sp.]|uniref:hypothetical protein n=1 Tax=Silvimonas sp. TaxID=2650811 RepID=UPI002845BE50|nr:hypothetical protein [Silvimonas sp.]MDR3428501.1 hypothetical protein [Silvimonas sp.]
MPASTPLPSHSYVARQNLAAGYINTRETLVSALGLGWRTPLWRLVRPTKPAQPRTAVAPTNRAKLLANYQAVVTGDQSHEELIDTYA